MTAATSTTLKALTGCLLLLLCHVSAMEEYGSGPRLLVPSAAYGCVPLLKDDIPVGQFRTICKTLEFDPQGSYKCCTHDGTIVCDSEKTGELMQAGTLLDYSGLEGCDSVMAQERGEMLEPDNAFMVKSGINSIKSMQCSSVPYGLACESRRVFVAYDWNEIDTIIGARVARDEL